MENMTKEFALIDLSEYNKLKRQLADFYKGAEKTVIKAEDLIFLSSVMLTMNATADSNITMIGDAITLSIYTADGNEVHSCFDVKLCEQYYNHISKFITDVM